MVAWYWLIVSLWVGGSIGFCIAGIIIGGSWDNRARRQGHADWAAAHRTIHPSPITT
jgi:hypothetical protein